MAESAGLHDFHNRLRIMRSIDRRELEAAGVIDVPRGMDVYEGCMREPNAKWARFERDPFDFLIRADDPTAQAIWSIIEARSGKRG